MLANCVITVQYTRMIIRQLLSDTQLRLRQQPAVVLLGPRQVGKTTLAHAIAAEQGNAVLLDMERETDRVQLSQPEAFLSRHRNQLIVMDEVQAMPEIFSALRPEIDAERQPGRFLLLGSASGRLLQQSSESLAGRVAYLELTPFQVREVADDTEAASALWLRGGFPQLPCGGSRGIACLARRFHSNVSCAGLAPIGNNHPCGNLAPLLAHVRAFAGAAFQRIATGLRVGRRVPYDRGALSGLARGCVGIAPPGTLSYQYRQAPGEIAQGLCP